MRVMRGVVLFCLTLAACGEWPDAGGPSLERKSADWPELLPLSEVITTNAIPPAEREDTEQLAARATALQRRAAILRANASDADAMEALRNRLR